MKALGSYVIGIRKRVTEKPDCVDEIYSTEQLDEVLPRSSTPQLIVYLFLRGMAAYWK